jgi:RNA recognition motif-containing protein
MCQFEHGETEHDIPEYDPDQPSLGTVPVPSSKGQLRPNRNINKSAKGGRPRAHFSLPGPSYDNANTTLVVEQIPEENFSEDTIRDFFSQFGTIVEVQMSAYKRLAIVKFADHAAANEAYNSPKAVFENRFVKVYWYKHDSLSGASKGSNGDAEMTDGAGEALDLEAIAKRQAEAQKAFEERQRKMADAEARAAEIERLLKGKNEEMTKIKQQLAELAKDETDGTMEVQYAKDLATLQAEAEGLFAENEALPPVGRGHGGPPRGTYQGAPRGRGYTPFPLRGRGAPRGSGYRGRGGFHATFARGKSSVKRLDNRPRRLAVANIEKGTAKDEALRQYLVVSRRFRSCAIYTR